jgi:Domain of unknown function (DUF3943)
MWRGAARGVAVGIWLSFAGHVPASFAQDSLATGALTQAFANGYRAVKSIESLQLEWNEPPRDATRSLTSAAIYAVAAVPDLSPAWALQSAPLNAFGPELSLVAAPREHIFLKGWATITSVEVVLLTTTMALPKSWTGWRDDYIQQGMHHLARAYTTPPALDHDYWYHNYVGHPYGGSVYYNTIRSQGASKTESFVFSALMSTQWEYLFEAVAERPSIQDLIVTPVSGRIFGELINRMTLSMVKGGTNAFEKVAITILNPMYVLHRGY